MHNVSSSKQVLQIPALNKSEMQEDSLEVAHVCLVLINIVTNCVINASVTLWYQWSIIPRDVFCLILSDS